LEDEFISMKRELMIKESKGKKTKGEECGWSFDMKDLDLRG